MRYQGLQSCIHKHEVQIVALVIANFNLNVPSRNNEVNALEYII